MKWQWTDQYLSSSKAIVMTGLLVTGFFIFLFTFNIAQGSGPDDCKAGYEWQARSGVGCVQVDCNDIPDAHWGYTRDCVCGSSGSIHEKGSDPNKACRRSHDFVACPSCVYACVHADDVCPDDVLVLQEEKSEHAEVTDVTKQPVVQNATQQSPQSTGVASVRPSLTTAVVAQGRTCQQECAKLMMGGMFDEVLEVSGTYPQCKCTVDIRDKNNQTIKTIVQNGDKRSTYEFDPTHGGLVKKTTISLMEERERIRQRLGFKYSEDEIDALLDDEKINKWFSHMMQDIDTRTSIIDPQFWWQHMVAIWDHGYGNSADFVDTYNFGRCGDSMQWLENNLAGDLSLTGKHDKKSEAMLSITGEKYGNMVNHTALMIRPSGVTNIEWADMVTQLMDKTRSGGLNAKDLKYIDPRLMKAKVIDPYFKKTLTVEEFIKGWAVLKIS